MQKEAKEGCQVEQQVHLQVSHLNNAATATTTMALVAGLPTRWLGKSHKPFVAHHRCLSVSPKITCQATNGAAPQLRVSKREMLQLAAGWTATAFVGSASAKQPKQLLDKYYSETDDVIKHLHQILDIQGNPDSQPELLKSFKKDSSE